MIICAAGDIHGAFDRRFEDVLGVVAVPLSSVEPLDEQVVNSTLERIRNERGA